MLCKQWCDGEWRDTCQRTMHDTVLSSVRVTRARARVPLSHSTPPTKHIFGDFPSFDAMTGAHAHARLLCYFDGVKEEKDIGNLRSCQWFHLYYYSSAYTPGKGWGSLVGRLGRKERSPTHFKSCAKYDAAYPCISPGRQSSPCRLHTSDQQ